MHVPSEKIVVIPNGINYNSFNQLPEKGNFRRKYNINRKYIILYLGRLHEIKGIDFLIRSYAELLNERNDVTLVLAGPDDGFFNDAKLLIDKFNIVDHVIFTGLISGVEKLEVYVDADVLVYPSIFEIFGLVPFEAIMCGTPVIVTNDCGCGELILESKGGYSVEYGDTNSLKEKMRIILEDSQKGINFVNNGKKFIYEKLAWERIIKKMEKNYESCIHNF